MINCFPCIGLPLNCDVDVLNKVQDIIPTGSLIKCDLTKIENEENYYKISSPMIKMLLTRIVAVNE